MSERFIVESISIEGFRAFLRAQTLSFGTSSAPKSLAVLAANAHGKSSIVDAVEYFFSENGILSRMGERESGTKAGREPLTHVLAEAEHVAPTVSMQFRSGKDSFGDSRPVLGTATPLPASARRVATAQKAEHIIRGCELRAFVETRTPEERYIDLTRWFELEPIAAMQTQLRNLRRRITSELADTKAQEERLKDVQRLTKGAVTSAMTADVLAWINTSLAQPLGVGDLTSLAATDASYIALADRAKAEDAASMTTAASALKSLDAVATAGDAPEGALPIFQNAVAALITASTAEATERARSEKQIFSQVWSAAAPLLADCQLQSCPVCQKPFDEEGGGSRAGALAHIQLELGGLAGYNQAVATLKSAESAARTAARDLAMKVEVLRTSLASAQVPDSPALAAAGASVNSWQPGMSAPDLADLLAYTREQRTSLQAAAQPSPLTGTATAAISAIDGLRKAVDDLAEIDREQAALKAIHDGLGLAQTAIDQRIRTHVESIVSSTIA